MRDWFVKRDEASGHTGARQPDLAALRSAIEHVVRGKSDVVKFVLAGLLARGHILIEDVPGIGKTTLAIALARTLGLSFHRIQFTSDLMPSDVLGVSVYNQRTMEFEWKPGPIFTNILLADEINRATPKTQSALLEAMAENQVTADGSTRKLPEPFIVIATQNPSEHHGTYPLPESQLDRFLMRLHMGYPSTDDERQMIADRRSGDPLDGVGPVLDGMEMIAFQDRSSDVRVDDSLVDYLLQIVEATRHHDAFELGISPRGTLALFKSAQALALVEGRDYCIPDDIKRMVIPCFAHRVVLNSRSVGVRSRTREAEHLLRGILEQTAVPL
jgi:MoxR-like ATPase